MQKHHPEQQDDEIYLGNHQDYRRVKIGWKTWRAGKVAYDTKGNVLKNLEPVFVKRQEIEAAIVASDDAEKKRLWQGMLECGRIS